MPDENRQIFRPDALRRYAQSRNEVASPNIVRPRVFGLLSLLLTLLVILVGILCATRVPIYATGVAIAVAAHDDTEVKDHMLALAVFFPVAQTPRLATDQRVYIHWTPSRQPQIASLRSALPEALSPTDARQQFGLQGAAAAAIAEPSRVGRVIVEPPDPGSPPAAYLGSVRPCQAEVGTRTLLSLMPFTGSGTN